MKTAIEFRMYPLRFRKAACCWTRFLRPSKRGTTTALLGRSGSGKTTLLRTVNRMVEPTGGDVLVSWGERAPQQPYRGYAAEWVT